MRGVALRQERPRLVLFCKGSCRPGVIAGLPVVRWAWDHWQ